MFNNLWHTLEFQISVVTFLNSLYYIGFFPPCLNPNWQLREMVAGLARITSSYEKLSYHGFAHQAALPPRLCWYQDVCSAAILRGDLSDVPWDARRRQEMCLCLLFNVGAPACLVWGSKEYLMCFLADVLFDKFGQTLQLSIFVRHQKVRIRF